MGRTASIALAAKWRERIGRWRRSRLSIAEFCRREPVSQPSFFAWRKRLASQAAARGRGRPRAAEDAGREARFIELPPPRWSLTAGVRITLPGGAVVTLPEQASTELVAAAIRAATEEARPC